jgi:uncharacterized protein (UPF0261 family)
MIPRRGVSRYSIVTGPLHDPAGDAIYFAALKQYLPAAIEIVEVDAAAEDREFVHACCDCLLRHLAASRASQQKRSAAGLQI